MTKYLLKGGLTAELWPPHLERLDLRIHDGLIVERGLDLPATGEERVLDAAGKVVMPGLVCAHTHLYSALARGMPGPAAPPHNFLEILQKVWWKLDRALDEESLYASALVGAVEAVKAGTTTLIDHNASPGFIRGSLGVIARALEEVGLRGILCYEVTDRGGRAERDAGIAEQRDFLGNLPSPLVRGMVGGHAAFTLDAESLNRIGKLAAEFGVGAHIHVAEDLCDTEDSLRRYHTCIIERLAGAGLLHDRTLLAHGTHLDSANLDLVQQAGAWLVHNPRSNMNNAVGYAPVAQMGSHVALGTDGIGADLFEEAKAAFFRSQEARNGLGLEGAVRILANGSRLASLYFDQMMGTVLEGAAADLIVLDYLPPTPLHRDNLAGHFLFGMASRQVDTVMVAGRVLLEGGRFPHLNLDAVYTRARVAAERLWERMAGVPELVLEK